jgi:hypothetical protein
VKLITFWGEAVCGLNDANNNFEPGIRRRREDCDGSSTPGSEPVIERHWGSEHGTAIFSVTGRGSQSEEEEICKSGNGLELCATTA